MLIPGQKLPFTSTFGGSLPNSLAFRGPPNSSEFPFKYVSSGFERHVCSLV